MYFYETEDIIAVAVVGIIGYLTAPIPGRSDFILLLLRKVRIFSSTGPGPLASLIEKFAR
jgi:hypothetical protein